MGEPPRLTRRHFIAATGTAGAMTLGDPAGVAWAAGTGPAVSAAKPLGGGGRPTANRTIAQLARDHAGGEPAMFVDLAAVDQNIRVIVNFARANRWAVRPAFKAFQCPQLCAYVLARLPQPRGLVSICARSIRSCRRPLPTRTC